MIWIFVAIAVSLMFAPAFIRNVGLTILGIGSAVFLAVVILNRSPTPQPPNAPPAAVQPTPDTGKSRRFDFERYQQDKRDREDPEAKTRIPLSAVHFDQVQTVPGIDPGTIRTIRARVYNASSQFTLTDYSYYLEIQDCLPVKADDKHPVQCTTVFDQRDSVSTTVPANQARDVVIDLTKDPKTGAPPFKLLGTARVELSPTMTRAYVSSERG